jgi:hypothetical protein
MQLFLWIKVIRRWRCRRPWRRRWDIFLFNVNPLFFVDVEVTNWAVNW